MPTRPASGDAPVQPRISQRMVELIRLRHFSHRTEEAYLLWCRQFVEFHGHSAPGRMGATEITAFLNHLANARHVAASTLPARGR